MSADKTITANIIEMGKSDFTVIIDVSRHTITDDGRDSDK